MKGDGLKNVIDSRELLSYKLPKTLGALLKTFDKLQDYTAKAGRPTPTFVRLHRKDWMQINSAILQQSDGKHSAETVLYRGLPLIAHDQMPTPFTLEASP